MQKKQEYLKKICLDLYKQGKQYIRSRVSVL